MGIDYILGQIGSILNLVIPILITLGVIIFIWGVITYVVAKGEEAKKEGRDRMIWGIIGLTVIVTLWGLVNFLKSTLGIQDSALDITDIPCVPGVPGSANPECN